MMIEVFAIDIRDDRDRRTEFQERTIRLVRLDDEPPPAAEAGPASPAAERPADDHRRIEAPHREEVADQGRGRGLAVRSGDGDARLAGDERGEDIGAVHDLEPARERHPPLGVVLGDRARPDDELRRTEIPRVVADRHRDSERGEPRGRRGRRRVAARHGEAASVQHLREAAHPGAADPDEVGGTDAVQVDHRRAASAKTRPRWA